MGYAGYVLGGSSSESQASYQSLAQMMDNVTAEFGTVCWDVDIHSFFSHGHLSPSLAQLGWRTFLNLLLQNYNKSQLPKCLMELH